MNIQPMSYQICDSSIYAYNIICTHDDSNQDVNIVKSSSPINKLILQFTTIYLHFRSKVICLNK